MRVLVLVLIAGLLALPSAYAETISAVPLTTTGVNLSTTQTGNGNSTNVADRGWTLPGAALLKITTTVGATPTVTVDIEGSMDGTNFYNVAYALEATPETAAVAAIVITTATTGYYILRPDHPWRYLRLVYSSNTNVTTTADVFFGW